jgi:hypothetical protein
VNLVVEAANRGHQEAQAIVLRLSNALNISLAPDVRKAADDRLNQAVERGSRIATQDLKGLDQEQCEFFRSFEVHSQALASSID